MLKIWIWERIFIYIILIFIFAINNVNGAVGDILINNENKLLESGKPWTLYEGYEVTVTALDYERVSISLSKNGKEVHRKGEYKPYAYEYRNPNNISQLILRFRVIDINDNKIQLGNIFQFSDGSVLSPIPAPTNTPIVMQKLTFTPTDRKTLTLGEILDMGEGYTLTVLSIDAKLNPKQVWIVISRNGNKLDDIVLIEGQTYNNNGFKTKVERIYAGATTDIVILSDTYITSVSSVPMPTSTLIPTDTQIPTSTNRQWASSAIASSEYSPTRWSAAQATGAPDTFTYGDIQTAWATLRSDDSIQWIELKYSTPVYATGVNVYETYNPGALSKIDLKDSSGVYHTVWAGTDINTGIPDKAGWSNITFAQTTYPTKIVKLYLDTNLVVGWNEIDSAELIGTLTSATTVTNVPTTPTATPTLTPMHQTSIPTSTMTSMFSDNFSDYTLNSGWIVINKNSDSSVSLTSTGNLQISASPKNGGSDYYNRSNYNAPRILQRVTGDWIVETKMDFLPTNNYQGAGIVLCFEETPDSNTCNRVAERAFYPDAGGSIVKSVGSYVSYTYSTTYLRIKKEGISYTGWYSSDGTNWILNGEVTKRSPIKYVGLFTIRQPWDGNTNVYSATDYDYFTITPVPTSISQTPKPTFTTSNPKPLSTRIPNSPDPNSEESYIRILGLIPMVFLLSEYIKKFKK